MTTDKSEIAPYSRKLSAASELLAARLLTAKSKATTSSASAPTTKQSCQREYQPEQERAEDASHFLVIPHNALSKQGDKQLHGREISTTSDVADYRGRRRTPTVVAQFDQNYQAEGCQNTLHGHTYRKD